MSNELKLLLLLIAPQFSENSASSANLLMSGSLDWERFFLLCCQHGVAAIASERLKQCSQEHADTHYIEMLSQLQRTNVERYLFTSALQLKILNEFSRRQLDVLPFDGVLRAAAYNGKPLCDANSLHFLVNPSSIKQAQNIIGAFAHKQTSARCFKMENEVSLWLHSDIAWLESMKGNGIATLPRSKFRLGSIEAEKLTPPIEIVRAAIVGAKENWGSLSDITDLAWYLHSNDEQCLANAEVFSAQIGVAAALAEGRNIASELFENSDSNGIEHSPRTSTVARLELLASEQGQVQSTLASARMLDAPQARFHYVAKTLGVYVKRAVGEVYRNLVKGRYLGEFVPSNPDAVEKMLRMAKPVEGDLLFDLGSGDGCVLIEAATKYGIRAEGYELDPDLVELSRENVIAAGVENLVTIYHKNANDADLSRANIVTAYTVFEKQKRFSRKFSKELSKGARLVIHNEDYFYLWQPKRTELVVRNMSHVAFIHLWQL